MTAIITNDTSPRRRWLLPALAVVLLAVGLSIGIAVAASRNNASSAQPTTGAQVASVNQACTNWMTSATAAATNGSNWCSDMTTWMNQQITNGRITGSMMWGDADRMLTSCRAWAGANPANQLPPTWCSDMVTWMSGHRASDWNDWMKSGSMMGG